MYYYISDRTSIKLYLIRRLNKPTSNIAQLVIHNSMLTHYLFRNKTASDNLTVTKKIKNKPLIYKYMYLDVDLTKIENGFKNPQKHKPDKLTITKLVLNQV